MTNTTTAPGPAEVDLESMSKIVMGLHGEFLQSFMGLPIRVDASLEGSHYYIAVSRELLREIEKKKLRIR